MSTKFSKKFENFSNAENYYQNRRKSTLFRAFSSALGGMKNCRPSGNSVGRQKFFYFFAEMLRKHLMHSAQIRLSLRMERALRSGRWDSICCGKQPLNILEVVGLRAPTAVETCHRHSAKSRLSLRMEQALRSGRWDSFSAEKPRRLKHATGMFLRAAFRIPPSVKNKDHPDGWSLFWRRRWDSNPRGVLPPTRFRVELVMTTSILLRIAPVLQALIYSIMQCRKIQVLFPKS